MDEKIIYTQVEKLFEEGKMWGLSTAIDIHGCNSEIIKSPDKIREYIILLVKKIDMKAYGEPIIEKFGNNPKVYGYSFIQLIETSSITGHFAENTSRAYIDIFSCKAYDPNLARSFSQEYFEGKNAIIKIANRL